MIHGADADLIMLALATHEPNFYIVREPMLVKSDIICDVCQMVGHFSSDCCLIDDKFADIIKGVVDEETKVKVMAILNCKEETAEES